jgi:alkylation response protein AidB-like acyl-CoA dehydrogenase
MSRKQDLLEEAKRYLKEEIAAKANDIDADVDALRQALQGLCERKLMALRRPEEFGGPAFTDAEFREFQEEVARYSGSLAFLQTQHQSAVNMISKGDNHDFKCKWLPKMASGEALIGIGFSQLRRPGPPLTTAKRCEGGYLINGKVPWITGKSLFHSFLIAGEDDEGRAVFGLMPLKTTERGDGRIDVSDAMELAAMNSPQTVSAEVRNWFLRDEEVPFIKPPGWIKENDTINVTMQGFFAIGCARAALDVLDKAYAKREAVFIKETREKLQKEVDECRERLKQGPDLDPEERYKTRAWSIELCGRAAHAAVAASSGAANATFHPAQRIYRESLVYTVSAQTEDIMRTTLARLACG